MSTQLRTIDAQALAHASKVLVGFDRIFNDRFFNSQSTNYPPHNIVKYSENNYAIEVAVAGFSKEDIKISVDQDQLTISGVKNRNGDETDSGVEYLHRGLAARDFEQVFRLAEYMEVVGAKVDNGMLYVDLTRIIPEALKPRQIEIK